MHFFSDFFTTPCEGEIAGFVEIQKPKFGAGEHTGQDEIDSVELDDLENDDITEEETKRAEVDAASGNPKLPKHMAT